MFTLYYSQRQYGKTLTSETFEQIKKDIIMHNPQDNYFLTRDGKLISVTRPKKEEKTMYFYDTSTPIQVLEDRISAKKEAMAERAESIARLASDLVAESKSMGELRQEIVVFENALEALKASEGTA
jgi:hypothetical protein